MWQNSPVITSSSKTSYNFHSESFVTFDVPYWINCPHKGICGLWHFKQSMRSYSIFLNHIMACNFLVTHFCDFMLYESKLQGFKERSWGSHTGVNTSQKAIKKLILSTGSAGWKWWLCQWYFVYTKLAFLWLWKWKLLGTPKGVTKWT